MLNYPLDLSQVALLFGSLLAPVLAAPVLDVCSRRDESSVVLESLLSLATTRLSDWIHRRTYKSLKPETYLNARRINCW